MLAILNNMRVNGRALRAIRIDQGVTLRSLADRAGISAPYLSRIERGERSDIADVYVTALAQALALPVEAIASARDAA